LSAFAPFPISPTKLSLLGVAYALYVFSSLILTKRKRGLKLEEGCLVYKPVTVIIPVYNEGEVVLRSIGSIPNVDYPKEALHVRILDDSDDPESIRLVNDAVASLLDRGYRVSVERRANRVGGKAGFLREIMGTVETPYVFVLDSDFKLAADAISRAVSACESTGASYCQLAWSLEGEGPVAKMQQCMLNYHLSEEQERAASSGLPIKINGSCVLLNSEDLLSVGSWDDQTVTEDLDLTIRFALSGKRGIYLPLVGGVGLATPTFSSFFKQIKRWVIGNVQCMRRYGRKLLGAYNTFDSLISFSYLFNYSFAFSYFLILVAVLMDLVARGGLMFSFLSLLPAALLLAASMQRKCIYAYLASFAYSVFIASFLVEGLFRRRYGFVRTIKIKGKTKGISRILLFFAATFFAALSMWAITISKFSDALLLLAYALSFIFVTALW